MTDSDDKYRDGAAAPDTFSPTRSVRAAMIEREWLWRMAGLVLSIVVALVIASLTLGPAVDRQISIQGIDKVYHFIGYAALIFPLILTDSRRWAWAVPMAVAYGGLIELIQPTVGRSAEWLDFGANLAGVLGGAALAELLHDRIRVSVFASVDRQAEDAAETADQEKRLDDIRAELMEELRVVLREELASVQRPGGEDPVGPSPAEEAAPKVPAEPDSESEKNRRSRP